LKLLDWSLLPVKLLAGKLKFYKFKGGQMKRIIRHLFVLLTTISLTAGLAFAGEDEKAAAACAACGGSFFMVIIGLFVLNIIILVFVAKDAKSRGMENPVLWMILVLFTGILGLIIYLLARTSGELIQCSNCNNKRLKTLAKCPHCGN
jgi:cytochrome bd-type quinol oxidase subunit 2